MADPLEYIRQTYGVPARRGGIVLVLGKPGTITGASGPHVKIRMQGERIAHPYHPTDPAIVYEPRLKAEKVDGMGRAVDPAADYYVQDSRTFVGNCVSWWRTKGSGYTCDIDDAGVYKGAATLSMRDTDVPWPVDVALRNTQRFVDMQRLHHEREAVEATGG